MKWFWKYRDRRPLAGLAVILAVIAAVIFWLWVLHVNDEARLAWVMFSAFTVVLLSVDLFTEELEPEPEPEPIHRLPEHPR